MVRYRHTLATKVEITNPGIWSLTGLRTFALSDANMKTQEENTYSHCILDSEVSTLQ